jgi:hypothetical protein
VLRHLFGFTGPSLVAGTLTSSSTRTDPAVITAYLDACEPAMLDVDGNGDADPLTDGVLILRRLLDFSGSALIVGAVDDALCMRCDAEEIEPWIDSFLPAP